MYAYAALLWKIHLSNKNPKNILTQIELQRLSLFGEGFIKFKGKFWEKFIFTVEF
jgi:hypothetical protein